MDESESILKRRVGLTTICYAALLSGLVWLFVEKQLSPRSYSGMAILSAGLFYVAFWLTLKRKNSKAGRTLLPLQPPMDKKDRRRVQRQVWLMQGILVVLALSLLHALWSRRGIYLAPDLVEIVVVNLLLVTCSIATIRGLRGKLRLPSPSHESSPRET